METKRIIIGATLLAIAILVLCQVASAYTPSTWFTKETRPYSSFKSSQSNSKVPYDTRTSAQKYYYSYSQSTDSSDWRNKQVYNAVDYKKQNIYSDVKEIYTDNYYYKPRLSSNTQAYNWRF